MRLSVLAYFSLGSLYTGSLNAEQLFKVTTDTKQGSYDPNLNF